MKKFLLISFLLFLSSLGFSQGVYRVNFNQNDTLHPQVTILANTIGEIEWTRIYTGMYRGFLEGAFPAGKVWTGPRQALINNIDKVVYVNIVRQSVDYITMQVLESETNGVIDLNVDELPIEIRVYP